MTSEQAKVIADSTIVFTIKQLQVTQSQFEMAINATPTSERRNKLTDINVTLLLLIEQLNNLPST